jgi:hypothetical protein
MNFDIIGDIKEIVTIAKGAGIREIDRLRKTYGPGNWRKMKGIVRIRLSSGRKGDRQIILDMTLNI